MQIEWAEFSDELDLKETTGKYFGALHLFIHLKF